VNLAALLLPFVLPAAEPDPIALGSRRELFVDRYFIERLTGAELRLHAPHCEGVALRFDRPWEGPFSAYITVFRDGDLYRIYYRLKDADLCSLAFR
jgi:hypothetical protein